MKNRITLLFFAFLLATGTTYSNDNQGFFFENDIFSTVKNNLKNKYNYAPLNFSNTVTIDFEGPYGTPYLQDSFSVSPGGGNGGGLSFPYNQVVDVTISEQVLGTPTVTLISFDVSSANGFQSHTITIGGATLYTNTSGTYTIADFPGSPDWVFESGVVTLQVREGDFNDITIDNIVLTDISTPPADTTPPTITTTAVVSTIDEGLTALGSVSADEAVTWSVVGAGVSIDVNGVLTLDAAAVLGDTYTFTVTATDGATNATSTNEFSVTVNDITPPTITTTAVVSTIDEGLTALGSVSADEAVTWSVVGAGVSIDVNGVLTLDAAAVFGTTYTFTITATDVATNATSTNQFSVTVNDITPPVILSVVMVSNNPYFLRAKEGDVIRLIISANEVINTPTVTIAGETATVTYISLNDQWEATLTVGSSTIEGVVTFEISNISDVYNNAAANVSTLSFGGVTIDRTAPVATVTSNPIVVNINTNPTLTVQDINDGSNDNITDLQNLTLSLNKTVFTCDDIVIGQVSTQYLVTLTVKDQAGNTATATKTISVVDDVAPQNVQLVNPAYIHPTGTPYVEQGLTYDELCSTEVVIVSSDLDVNQWGTYTIVYKVKDKAGNESAEITRTQVVNNVPTTNVANFTVNQDTTDNILNVLAGDSFGPDGAESFVISGGNTTQGGTIIINGNGTQDVTDDTVLYSPRATYNGPDSFTYTIEDENGDTATRTVNIIVRPIVPVPVNDTATVDRNSTNNSIAVLANDDFGGNGANATHPLTFKNGSKVSASIQGGAISVDDNNTPNNLTDDFILYSPATDFVGQDTFEYVITDLDGDATSATVTITVLSNGQVSVPTAVNDVATVAGNSTLNVIDVLANDTAGLDGYINNGLTLRNGTLTGASTEGGLIAVDTKNTNNTSDDEFTYSPKAGFTGTDTFQYVITDASGDASNGVVTVTVTSPTALLSTPTATDDTASVAVDSTGNVLDVLSNDTPGTDGYAATPIASATVTTVGAGTVTIVGNDLVFTPTTGFEAIAIIEYTIEDLTGDTDTGIVTVTVGNPTPPTPPSTTPTAVADSAAAVQNGGAVTIDVLSNDNFGTEGPSATHPLTFKNGSLTNASTEGGSITISNNAVVYTPAKDFNGTDTFEYTITDVSGDASTATVTITVSASSVVSVPTAVNDVATVAGNSTLNVIDVLANDTAGLDGYTDNGLTLRNGTLTGASIEGGLIAVDTKNTNDTSDDEFTYSPKAGFTGTDTFEYVITDANGDASTGVVTVTVTSPTALLNTPTATDDTASVAVDSTGNVLDVLSNDTPGTDGYAATPIASATVTTASAGTVSIVGNDLVFDPTTGFEGIAIIEYTIEDLTGDTDTGIVTVTVGNPTPPTPPSTTPTAVDDTAAAVQNGGAVTITVLSNDSFGAEGPSATHPLTFKNGSLVNASTEGGSITILNNEVVYTPAKDFNGTDTFEYTITDVSGDASTATVTITVSASSVVSVPTAVNDAATVAGNSTLNVIDVLANDTAGLDGYINNGLTLRNGTLTGASTEGGLIAVDTKNTNNTSDDEFTYSPKAGFTGTDTFQYVITDASGDASTATVTVTVTALPALGYSPDTATVIQNSTNNIIDVMANDTDDAGFGPTDTRFLIESVDHLTGTTTQGGTVALETYNTPDTSDDVILYTPLAGFVGQDTFNYVPGNDRNALVLVTVTVEPAVIVNGTPTAVNDTYSIDRTGGTGPAIVYINVTANDTFGTDGPNATHPLTLINGKTDTASNGGQRIKIDDNGTPTNLSDDRIAYYSTNNASVTSDSFTYTITDANGDASTATVTITLSATSPKTGGVNTFGGFTVKDNTFVTYPNPTKGAVKSVLFSTISTKATVLLFDITGKTIYKANTNIVKGKNELDFNFQAKGILFLKIVSPDMNFGVSKVVFE